jgi:predicted permease
MSLAYTISGLHWDVIPGDNDEEVAARGILYLLIFQQLGQLLRWSWGYHVLLAPPSDGDDETTPPNGCYRDDTDGDVEAQPGTAPFMTSEFENSLQGFLKTPTTERDMLLNKGERNHRRTYTSGTTDSAFESGPSGGRTPVTTYPSTTSLASKDLRRSPCTKSPLLKAAPLQGNGGIRDIVEIRGTAESNVEPRWSTQTSRCFVGRMAVIFKNSVVQFACGLWAFMNPPLWAMLAAVIVASVPKLQALFFTKGTFLNTSVTRAVAQSGNVAVPLILVVLGANLANNTSKTSTHNTPQGDRHGTKVLIASLISRMVLPLIFIAPVLALAAKYLNISILDDPIFVVVCFLLMGAPSALQLAQICQINNVYEDVITRVLFWSYVVVILPSTLVLVITAIGVVKWAM